MLVVRTDQHWPSERCTEGRSSQPSKGKTSVAHQQSRPASVWTSYIEFATRTRAVDVRPRNPPHSRPSWETACCRSLFCLSAMVGFRPLCTGFGMGRKLADFWFLRMICWRCVEAVWSRAACAVQFPRWSGVPCSFRLHHSSRRLLSSGFHAFTVEAGPRPFRSS